jgi:Tat protein translocase TatB subunit
MFGMGMGEIVLIFVVALLVLGPDKLPGVARSVAKALRTFRHATDDLKTSLMEVKPDINVDMDGFLDNLADEPDSNRPGVSPALTSGSDADPEAGDAIEDNAGVDEMNSDDDGDGEVVARPPEDSVARNEPARLADESEDSKVAAS